MILKFFTFRGDEVQNAVHKLPEHNMTVDPRPSNVDDGFKICFKFKFTVKGKIMTVKRILIEKQDEEDRRRCCTIGFRVYNRNEFRYLFEETKYLFHSLNQRVLWILWESMKMSWKIVTMS